MSKEYWTEVAKSSCKEESILAYEHLTELYLDYWKDRSILTELVLDASEGNSPTGKPEIIQMKKVKPKAKCRQSTLRRLSMGPNFSYALSENRDIIHRYQENKKSATRRKSLIFQGKKPGKLLLSPLRPQNPKFSQWLTRTTDHSDT